MSDPQESIKEALATLVQTVKQGGMDVAITALKEFLQAHPDNEIASGLLAASYFQIGMRDEAQRLYQRLLSSYPHNALARFQLGLLRLSDDPREALSLWAPLRAGEGEFMAHFHCALAHLQLNEPQAARPLLDHAAQYMPQTHPLREQLDRLRDTLVRDTGALPGDPA